MSHDVFAVFAAVVTIANASAVPGSFVVWQVDLRSEEPAVSEIASLPEAGLLNGMTVLDSQTRTVLIADSARGVIWRLNTHTGAYSVALADETMQPAANARVQLGVNGVRVCGRNVYYTSTTQGLFCRVSIDATGSTVSAFDVIASWPISDDFALRPDGSAYVAVNSLNEVIKVASTGETLIVIGSLNSTIVAGATSARFGRTKSDHDLLYVTTSGGQVAPVNGTFTEGGKIVAMNLNKLWRESA